MDGVTSGTKIVLVLTKIEHFRKITPIQVLYQNESLKKNNKSKRLNSINGYNITAFDN